MLGCGEGAAVVLARFDDGVDGWVAVIVGGFEVGDEWVDGLDDGIVGGEDPVDAAGGFV